MFVCVVTVMVALFDRHETSLQAHREYSEITRSTGRSQGERERERERLRHWYRMLLLFALGNVLADRINRILNVRLVQLNSIEPLVHVLLTQGLEYYCARACDDLERIGFFGVLGENTFVQRNFGCILQLGLLHQNTHTHTLINHQASMLDRAQHSTYRTLETEQHSIFENKPLLLPARNDTQSAQVTRLGLRNARDGNTPHCSVSVQNALLHLQPYAACVHQDIQ
jgi:hypothetical protein